MSVDSWSSPFADSLNFLKFAHFSNSLDLLHGQIANVFLVYCPSYLVSTIYSEPFLSFFPCRCLSFLLDFLTAFSLSLHDSSSKASLFLHDFFSTYFLASHLFSWECLFSSKFGRDLQTFFLFPRPFFSLYFFCKFYYKLEKMLSYFFFSFKKYLVQFFYNILYVIKLYIPWLNGQVSITLSKVTGRTSYHPFF